MRHRLALAIMGMAVAGTVASLLLPGVLAPDLAREGTAAIVTIIAVTTALRQQGPARVAWLLVTSGVALWVVGDIVWDLYDAFAGAQPSVSAADACYLLGYPIIAAGLLVMLRRRAPASSP